MIVRPDLLDRVTLQLLAPRRRDRCKRRGRRHRCGLGFGSLRKIADAPTTNVKLGLQPDRVLGVIRRKDFVDAITRHEFIGADPRHQGRAIDRPVGGLGRLTPRRSPRRHRARRPDDPPQPRHRHQRSKLSRLGAQAGGRHCAHQRDFDDRTRDPTGQGSDTRNIRWCSSPREVMTS